VDIERMVKDAELFAQKDKARKELIEAKNEADTTLYTCERSLSDHKEKLPAVRPGPHPRRPQARSIVADVSWKLSVLWCTSHRALNFNHPAEVGCSVA